MIKLKKIRECELVNNLKEFQTKSTIEINFTDSLNGKIILEDATITYDEKKGYIHIVSKNGDFKINTTLVYDYEKANNKINIELDRLYLKIKKS